MCPGYQEAEGSEAVCKELHRVLLIRIVATMLSMSVMTTSRVREVWVMSCLLL